MNEDARFTKFSQAFISHRAVLESADIAFWDDWRRILQAVDTEFQTRDYYTGVCVDRNTGYGWCQVARRHWPKPVASAIHFEVAYGRWTEVDKDHASIALDVEESVPDREKLIRCIQRLLEPYVNGGFVRNRTGCAIIANSGWRVFRGAIPLADISSQKIVHAMTEMLATETFVDEGLFLVDKTALWRTSFLADDPQPEVKWPQWQDHTGATGETGGWERLTSAGRLGSPCLKCSGDRSNWREGRSILWLWPKGGAVMHALGKKQKVYGCAVVHAAGGGKVTFYGEATDKGGWALAFEGAVDVAPFDGWQVVTWRGEMADVCDFAETGMHAFVIVKASERGLRIDSIEIGVVP